MAGSDVEMDWGYACKYCDVGSHLGWSDAIVQSAGSLRTLESRWGRVITNHASRGEQRSGAFETQAEQSV